LLLRAAPLLSGLRSTSPIVRGVFVRKRLLCANLPSPDFSIVSARTSGLEEADPVEFSTREIMARLTAPAPCMQCHSQINPLGFALESFDPLGRVRSEELVYDASGQQIASHPIDTYSDGANLGAGASGSLGSADELVEALSDNDSLRACFAKRLFATGQLRTIADADGCALYEIQQALEQGKTLREAWIAAVVNDDLFYKRAESFE
jgi:hypothetical protein